MNLRSGIGVPDRARFEGEHATPIDITATRLELEIDPRSKVARARASVRFRPLHAGFPLLDLVPRVETLELNGKRLEPERLATVMIRDDGEDATVMRLLKERLEPGAEAQLSLSYSLEEQTRLDGGVAGFGFFMSDAELPSRLGRHFLEQYAPANLEFDQHELTVSLVLSNASQPHMLYANGQAVQTLRSYRSGSWEQRWELRFPAFYTASSPYLHLVSPEPGLVELVQHVDSLDGRTLPVTVYSRDGGAASHAMHVIRGSLPEMERAFGAFPHPSLLVYATQGHRELPAGVRGMEYCGAAMVDAADRAVRHELAHSWFGRGVLPASGNDGWLDEAIVEWYLQARAPNLIGSSSQLPNLNGFSSYRRTTPVDAYVTGPDLLCDADARLRSAGAELADVLRAYHTGYSCRTSSTGDFLELVAKMGNDRVADALLRNLHAGRALGRASREKPEAIEVAADPKHVYFRKGERGTRHPGGKEPGTPAPRERRRGAHFPDRYRPREVPSLL